MTIQGLDLLYSREQIERDVFKLAERIQLEYSRLSKPLLIIGILKGSFIFLADLSRNINIPHEVDFIKVASRDGTMQTKMELLHGLSKPATGKHVIIVDDISDSGETMKFVREIIEKDKPASISTCAIIMRQGETRPDYYAFVAPAGKWLVGYGMDKSEEDRTLPAIYTIKGK